MCGAARIIPQMIPKLEGFADQVMSGVAKQVLQLEKVCFSAAHNQRIMTLAVCWCMGHPQNEY